MDLVILLLCFSVLLVNTVVEGIGRSSRTRISDKKCDYYRNIITSLPKEFNDTEDASPKEFPFMARIYNDTQYFSGVLISENFVLSTAASIPFHGGSFVMLGDLDAGTNSDDAKVQIYNVIEVMVHPDFNYYDHMSDIRLFKLNQSVQFNEYVRPACLSPFPISQHLIEIGWSETNIRNNKRLHKVRLNYVSKESCKEAYKSDITRMFISSIDNATIFCARKNKSDRVMCAGSTGSAVINADRKTFDEIVGIASFGFLCEGDNPDVFVNVLEYIDWIESIVWPIKPKEPLSIKYFLIIITAGVTFVLICICLGVCFGRSRDKENHQNTMNVHMHINH